MESFNVANQKKKGKVKMKKKKMVENIRECRKHMKFWAE